MSDQQTLIKNLSQTWPIPSKTSPIIIIGTGGIVKDAHLPAYKKAGFDVVWAGNFVDQGWFKTQEEVNAKRWIFDSDLALKSFVYVANKAPKADAILINGMCNFRTGKNSLPQRPIHLVQELENIGPY